MARKLNSNVAGALRRLNPAFGRATAVRVRKLKSGSISLTPLRGNVAQGFYNETGFHPIRASKDYDPDRAGDEY